MGGVLSTELDDLYLIFSFPPGCVDQDVVVTVTGLDSLPTGARSQGIQGVLSLSNFPQDTSSAPGNVLLEAFSLEAVTLAGDKVYALLKDYTILIYYIESNLGDVPEDSLQLHRWDATSREWQILEIARDLANDSITTTLSHLGIFSLNGQSGKHLYLPLLIK
jgi:hypothetical protein